MSVVLQNSCWENVTVSAAGCDLVELHRCIRQSKQQVRHTEEHVAGLVMPIEWGLAALLARSWHNGGIPAG